MNQAISNNSQNNYYFLLGVLILAILFIGCCYLNGYKIFIIASGSMEPAITIGSLAVVQPEVEYYPGQVISYYKTFEGDTFTNNTQEKSNEIIVTHRIVGMLNQQGELFYRTKGDVNLEPDNDLVPHSRVIGRVIIVIPVIGYLFVLPQTKIGFYLLVCMTIGWLCLIFIKMLLL